MGRCQRFGRQIAMKTGTYWVFLNPESGESLRFPLAAQAEAELTDQESMRRLRDSAPKFVPQPPQVVSTFADTKLVPSRKANAFRVSSASAVRNPGNAADLSGNEPIARVLTVEKNLSPESPRTNDARRTARACGFSPTRVRVHWPFAKFENHQRFRLSKGRILQWAKSASQKRCFLSLQRC